MAKKKLKSKRAGTTATILWIDDRIDDYKSVCTELAQYGINVLTAASHEDALPLIDESVDLVLLDLRMPGKSGFDVIKVLDKMGVKASICVLSSYLHLKDYQRKLRQIGAHIAVLDKDLPAPGSEAFPAFVENLQDFIANPPRFSPRDYEKRFTQKKHDPFSISFKEYLALPSRFKRELRENAEEILSNILKKEFDEGAIWVLFCGDNQTPVRIAESQDKIPTSDQIMQIAYEQDAAPFQFAAPVHSDDLWSGSCEGPAPEAHYPTVTIDFNRSGSPGHFHFDTGSPYTFASFEFLNEMGILPIDGCIIASRRGMNRYEFVLHKAKITLFDQVDETKSKSLTLFVRAVLDWFNCPFSATCPQNCPNHAGNRESNCMNRNALIGRNIILENELEITISGVTNKTSCNRATSARNDQ